MNKSKPIACPECSQDMRFHPHLAECPNHPSKWSKTYAKKAESSIPISKIEELIANCNDKTNFNALEDDLQTLIDETKK
jgi:hypothetical protein